MSNILPIGSVVVFKVLSGEEVKGTIVRTGGCVYDLIDSDGVGRWCAHSDVVLVLKHGACTKAEAFVVRCELAENIGEVWGQGSEHMRAIRANEGLSARYDRAMANLGV